jgi:hypothetical protein
MLYSRNDQEFLLAADPLADGEQQVSRPNSEFPAPSLVRRLARREDSLLPSGVHRKYLIPGT